MALVPKESSQALQTITEIDDNKVIERKKIVLKEEEYVSKIDQIIERDFFPDLERLRLKNKYQEAIDSNDLEKLRDVQIKWGELVANESSDLKLLDTETRPLLDLETLDDFLSKYTSEDNISFEQIVEETKEKIKKKYWWLYETQEHAAKALTHGSAEVEQKSIQTEPESSLRLMNTWNYTPKNALMYSPESVSLTADELNEMQKGVPVINHTNTRISRDYTKGIEILSQAILSARTKTQTNIGHMGVDGRIEESCQSKSYSMVVTPSPAPGESPIMTWGEIGSTPLRIDTPGPAFKIPDTPAREELLFKLDADNINKRKQNLKSKSDRIRFKAGKSSLTPSQRLKFLSPAAQLLASKTGVVTPTPLRTNYTPHLTPIITPTSSRLNRTPLIESTNSSDSTPISSSLTDNLLKFMEK